MYKLPDNPGVLTPSRMIGNNGIVYAMPYWIALENDDHWNAILDKYENNKNKTYKKVSSMKEYKVLGYMS